ncbi:MAG: hypothetical protein ACI4KI_04060 [Candidatus Fimenecus sp.]
MATNKLIKDSVGWYYLDAQGRMMTNSWLQWNGNWYYLDENGYMATSTARKNFVKLTVRRGRRTLQNSR